MLEFDYTLNVNITTEPDLEKLEVTSPSAYDTWDWAHGRIQDPRRPGDLRKHVQASIRLQQKEYRQPGRSQEIWFRYLRYRKSLVPCLKRVELFIQVKSTKFPLWKCKCKKKKRVVSCVFRSKIFSSFSTSNQQKPTHLRDKYPSPNYSSAIPAVLASNSGSCSGSISVGIGCHHLFVRLLTPVLRLV